jgi:DNA-directed RNA polymerase specialized sigma24 family protein
MNSYRPGEAYDERYCLELLRRATVGGDQLAWEYLQQLFSGLVRGWLRRHPGRETASRLDSEENYIALAFERFWQATAQNQRIEFSTIAAALQYLRASLHGVILDTLRTYTHRREVALPETDFPGEPFVEDEAEGSEAWELLKRMLPGAREQRLAYLLFHCGLKPREIVRFCSSEFGDVHEVYRMRRNIIERLRRDAHRIRRQLA